MKVLVIDSCIRRNQSRTKVLLDDVCEFIKKESPETELEFRDLMNEDIQYLNTESLAKRDELIAAGAYDHPRFDYAHQFARADAVIVAAPFWDLSIPALLKIYIENISVDGITFGCSEKGLYGLSKAEWMLFLTTRGSDYSDSSWEQGVSYMKALSEFLGVDEFCCAAADNLDIGVAIEPLLTQACDEAKTYLAEKLKIDIRC